MPISEHRCVTVTCDGCGDGWDEGPWHFTSEKEATDYLAAAGWVVTPRRILCNDCARVADCEATGHQYTDASWLDHERSGVRFRSRNCDHCGAVDYDPPWRELKALSDAAAIIDAASKET